VGITTFDGVHADGTITFMRPLKKAKREIASIQIRIYPSTHKLLLKLSRETGRPFSRIVDDGVHHYAGK
jgi:hypothetical protein